MSSTENKWAVHRWRCRCGRCKLWWMVTPPDDLEEWWPSLEFDTWAEAMAFANSQAWAGLR